MKVTLKIKRFNPEKDTEPYWGEYQVEAEPTDRLLDALNYVKWYLDGTLTFRRSCAHGICGSDGIVKRRRHLDTLMVKIRFERFKCRHLSAAFEELVGHFHCRAFTQIIHIRLKSQT